MLSSSHFHPISVHFPIALLLLGVVVEILSFTNRENKFYKEGALYLMLLGALGTVVSYLTGEFMTEEMSGAAGELKEIHELWAKIAMFGSLITSGLYLYYLIRDRYIASIRITLLILYCFVAVSIAITGYYGGVLVYDYMVTGN